jgi:hypothetical protein
MFGSFLPSPLVVCASKVYSADGADIVMESSHSLTTPILSPTISTTMKNLSLSNPFSFVENSTSAFFKYVVSPSVHVEERVYRPSSFASS